MTDYRCSQCRAPVQEGYTYSRCCVAEVGELLSASDPEPLTGTVVRDSCGRDWTRDEEGDPSGWGPDGGGDPESWAKVAGNYGPVVVIEWGDEICEAHDVPMKDGVCSCCLADSAAAGRWR